MQIDFKTLSPTQAYHLMTQSIVPRPIAWVLTENEPSEEASPYNLAPFSYFNAVASDPPILMFSIGMKPDGGKKDTLLNIERSEKLVIHIASAEHIKTRNQRAASLPYGESELTQSALTTTPFDGFKLPRLSDAKIALGCTLNHFHVIGNAAQTLVFANLETAYYSDAIVQQDETNARITIDAESLNPLARMGGTNYAFLGEFLSLKRPT